MTIEEVNFRTLIRAYESRGAVLEARDITARYTPKRLATLLRHHRDGTVEGRDVERRAAFDELLEYYSLMEVACVAGYVPRSLPEDYVQAALAALGNQQVAAYYETKYPLLLPRLHRERLRGRWKARERGADLPARFMAFTELNKALDDEDVDVFLWFLEDGSVDDVSIDDLLAIVADPTAFGEAMAGDPDEPDPTEAMSWEAIEREALANPGAMLARLGVKGRQEPEVSPAHAALRGFRKFLFFSRDLDALLSSMEETPLTRSAMWHYHSYWFDEMGYELRPYLHGAIDRFLSWEADDAAAASRSRIAAEMHDSVSRLTSEAYALPLREAEAKALERKSVRKLPVKAIVSRAAADLVLGGAAALAVSKARAIRTSAAKKPAGSRKAASPAKRKPAPSRKAAKARPSMRNARVGVAAAAKPSRKAAKAGRKRAVAKAARRGAGKAAKRRGGRKSQRRATRRA